MEKRIVVLGGSFNPPTKAHSKLLDTAIKQTDAEFGIFVPSSDNYVTRKMSKQSGNNKVYSQQSLHLDFAWRACCTCAPAHAFYAREQGRYQ